MKLKTLLIDDETHCIEWLEEQLQPFSHAIEIVGQANSAIRGLAQIDKLKPDLVFLDVSMPGGTGFEMLDQINQKKFHLIFTSAHQQYAINAFNYSAVNYLLKPIEKDELEKAIQQVLNKDSEAPTPKKTSDIISVNTHAGHQIIPVEEVIHFEAEGAYTSIHLEGGSKLLSSQNIKVYQDQLSEHIFCRIHKKHLVNLKKIKYFTKGKGGHATLTNGVELSISFRQKSHFLKMIQDHLV
jgi:two-component system LytT family response regulator